MNWLRLYSSLVRDPKVQRLSGAHFKLWINLLCLANQNDPRGVLPDAENIAFALQMRPVRCQAGISALLEVGLIDATDGGLVPHNWDSFQYKSDDVTARVKRYRDVTGNPSRARADPETEKRRTDPENAPAGATSQPPIFKDACKAFVSAPKNERVARLIDLAYSLDLKRSGIAAKIVRDYGHGQSIVDAMVKAARYADGDPWEYMIGALKNGARQTRREPARSRQAVATKRQLAWAQKYADSETDELAPPDGWEIGDPVPVGSAREPA